MKQKIYILMILFVLSGLQYTRGQETDIYKVRSPQSADMIRYGNVPIAKNSGRLDLSIPLLAIDDPDFNFPLSIRYNSSGYIPSKAESAVGLDWSLIAGGAIYREVRDTPDDLYISGEGNKKGFLRILKEGVNLDKNQIFNNPSQYIQLTMSTFGLKNSGIEVASDIYNFSFGPYSGKFTINFDGTTNVLSTSGGKFKVDLSGYNYCHQDFSMIKITTDNGYIYSFGGSKDAMEYTISYSSPGEYTTLTHPSSFHLSEILAPNGRKLEIIYSSVGDFHSYYSELLESIGPNRSYLKNYSFSSCPVSFATRTKYTDMRNGYLLHQSYTPQFHDSHTLTKVALIDEIKIDDQSLKFHYSSRPNVIYDRYMVGEFPANCGAVLDSVCHQKQNKTVNKVNLNYATYGNNSRFFLNKLILSDSQTYTFDYNRNINFPVPRTKDLDYWGFWRNKGSDVANVDVPDDSYNTMDYIFDRAEEESAKYGFDQALLNSITYPTGGYTQIIYEHHMYSRKIDIVTNDDFSPKVGTWPVDLKAGGARVKYLYTYVNGKEETKMFKYLMDPKNQYSRSSGIISNYPRYADSFSIPKEGSNASTLNGNKPSYSPYNGINFQTKYMDHISYSKVTEVLLEDEVTIPGSFTYSSPPLMNEDGKEEVFRDTLILNEPPALYSWKFEGVIGGPTVGSATIYFRNVQTNNITTTIELHGNQIITDKPLLGPGRYIISMKKTGRYSVNMKVIFPGGDKYTWTGPYTITSFSDYSTNPDNFLDDKVLSSTNSNYSTYAWNSQRDVQRRDNERGKILKEEYYTSEGKLKKKDEYMYRSDDMRFNTNYGVYGRVMYGLLYQMSKDYFYPFNLVSKTTTEYITGSENVTAATNYVYNTDGYLKETSTQNSMGKNITNKLYYPFDIDIPVHQTMINRNILSGIIREEEYVNSLKTKHINNNYMLHGNLPVLSTIENGMSSVPKEIMKYDDYDALGKPRTLIYNNALKVALLWGYNQQYIVARIEGATYSEIKEVLTESLILEIANSIQYTDALNQLIRTRLNNEDVHITTYEYLPLVGVSSITDPAEKVTYYEYDSFNRLKEIYIKHENKKENKKEILEAYEYNYANQ